MDEYNIYEGAFSGPQIDNILANSTRQDAIAIVSNNNTHIAITAGQYVYVKGHGTLAEGMYKANSNIQANGTLTKTNLTAVSNGVANELKSAIDKSDITSAFTLTLPQNVTEWDTGFQVFKSGNTIQVFFNFKITNATAGDQVYITMAISENRYKPGSTVIAMISDGSATGYALTVFRPTIITIYPAKSGTIYAQGQLCYLV